MRTSWFSSYTHSVLASIDDSCVSHLVLLCLQNGDFSISITSFTFIGWNILWGRAVPFEYILTQLLNSYLCVLTFPPIWVIIHYYHYLYYCSQPLWFAIRSFFWLYVLVTYLHYFFDNFLTFWHHKMLQVHLFLFLCQHWNPPFLQGFLVPFVGDCILKSRSGC